MSSHRLAVATLVWLAGSAAATPIAERITAPGAAAHSFGGSDVIGGIGDWYVSNGIVEAIIDDAGPQEDLLPLLGSATPPKQNLAAGTGGTLVDLALVGHDNDQFAQMFSVAGLSNSNRIFYRTVAASVTGDTAVVTATGGVRGFDSGASPVPPDDLEVATAYSTSGDDPFLLVTTTITNRHPTNTATGLGTLLDPITWTQRGPIPFSPLPSRGFRHGVLDLSNIVVGLEFPLFAAAPGNLGPDDGVLDPATGTGTGEVAYGLLPIELSVDDDGDGPGAPLVRQVQTLFGVSNNTTTALGPTPITAGLAPGAVLRYSRRLYVGDRNDVAAVTDRMLPVLAGRFGFAVGTISGDVDATDTRRVIATLIATRTAGPDAVFAPGAPITHRVTDRNGRFAGVVLPEGTYDVEVRTPVRPAVTVHDVVVAAGTDTRITIPRLASVGTLALRAVELRRGGSVRLPARIVVRGLGDTPDPTFHKTFDATLIDPAGGPDLDLHPETFGGGPAQGNTVLVGLEPVRVQLPPGRYELIATHGPTHALARRRITVRAGRRTAATFALRPIVVPTDGLSADFHVHSARSFDASAPLAARVVSYAAEGVDVIVATDHDRITDYAPVIAAMGLGRRIASIVGDEVTSAVENPPSFPASIGHWNGFPLTPDPTAPRDGAILDELVAPNMVIHRLRTAGAGVVQVNHPRDTLTGLTSLGFFTNIGFDPDLSLNAPPNDVLLDRDVLGPGRSGVTNPGGYRNLDFDTLEIANGLSIESYLAVRRDWMSLLNQTDRVTVPFIAGTAVSDSHRLTLETPGYFRTWVLGAGTSPVGLDVGRFTSAVRAGAMIGTNGPQLRVTVDAGTGHAGPGEVLATPDGTATLGIVVDTVPWIPVEEVRVFMNGVLTDVFDSTTTPAVTAGPADPFSRSAEGARRFDAQIPLTLAHDTWVIVEAGVRLDPQTPTPTPLDLLVPGIVPLAFSNPVFIDVGGNGVTPSGLSASTGNQRTPGAS